jgi:hypothetical protein
MNQFIDTATPLVLSLFLSVIGIAAALITEAKEILTEPDVDKRKAMARHLILSALAPNLCLGAVSLALSTYRGSYRHQAHGYATPILPAS